MPYVLPAGAGLIAFAAGLCAQSPPAGDRDVILRSNTRVVEIDVTVRDAQGKPVPDLTKDDFTITDDGKSRSFSIFSANRFAPSDGNAALQENSAPAPPLLPPNTFTNAGPAAHPLTNHSTVLLLDAVNGWSDNFALASRAVRGMLNKVPADEKIALYALTKHRGLAILQQYTLDRAALANAMAKYTPEWMCPAPSGFNGNDDGMHEDTHTREDTRNKHSPTESSAPPPPRSVCRNLNAMQMDVDAVRASLDSLAQILRNQPGRKSVFWVTQGFPPSLLRGDQAWDRTVSRLNDANIEVNTVDSNGIDGPPRFWGAGGTLTLIGLAERTGGTAYHHRNDLDAALATGITGSRAGYYLLGFYLTEVDGRYHQLKVHVTRPNLRLNYRQGYSAADEAQQDRSKKNMDLTAALLNPAGSREIGITASLVVNPAGPPGTVNVRMILNPEALSLKPGAHGKTVNVKILFVETNAASGVVGRQSVTGRFEIVSAAQAAAFERQGVTVEQVLLLPADAVLLSIVVQDARSGTTGSLTVPLGKVAPGGRPPPKAAR